MGLMASHPVKAVRLLLVSADAAEIACGQLSLEFVDAGSRDVHLLAFGIAVGQLVKIRERV